MPNVFEGLLRAVYHPDVVKFCNKNFILDIILSDL